MTLFMNLATLPLIFSLNVWVFIFLAIVVICVGFIIYKRIFLLLLLANVVPLSTFIYLLPSNRLAHSWGRKPILICGLALVVLGSLLTAWFPSIIIHQVRCYWMWREVPISGWSFYVYIHLLVISIICHETSIGQSQDCASFDFFYMLIYGNTVAK
ncbi:hypothetical protein H5410_002327 [Solanum commersonii]|uniref:Uncharacterized protein n=1 Tax=Solanum commersonii TaxID=4109 RepID=A0A9J6B210_SOLCO|nr:hypothetical protein H5410_002327 [Solanum commersonii]